MIGNNEYSIRRANIDDAEIIFGLWKELAKDHNKKNKGIEIEISVIENPYFNILKNDRNILVYVAENKNEIFAFAEVYLKEPDEDFDLDRYAYVLHCYVKTEYRNTISIIKMLDMCIVDLKEMGIHYLLADVFVSNTKFYKNIKLLGFEAYKTKYIREISDEER